MTIAADGRGAPRSDGIEALLRPRSVAVIGASRQRGTIGAEIFHNLITRGFEGVVYPVNSKAPVVQSVQAYPSIDAVPGPVDLAVVVVPAAAVPAVIDECGRAGVRSAIVISAGFKETGEEGPILFLLELASHLGVGFSDIVSFDEETFPLDVIGFRFVAPENRLNDFTRSIHRLAIPTARLEPKGEYTQSEKGEAQINNFTHRTSPH